MVDMGHVHPLIECGLISTPTFEVSMAKPFDQKIHLIINLAVGGAFVGMEPDPDWQESEFRIPNLVVEIPV